MKKNYNKTKSYNKTNNAEKLKTIGALLIEVTGKYDNQTSKKLGAWLRNKDYTEGDDYLFVEMPNPTGNGEIVGAKAWRSHTWNLIRNEIKSIQELL